MQTLLGIALACGLTLSAKAQGTWTKLTNPAPENIGLMLQLMDGRVMAAGTANNTWYTLTPDAFGSYANGTWSPVASMATKRLFYASKVLPNGDILIAGGEYTGNSSDTMAGTQTNTNLCERYSTQTNTWGLVPTPIYGGNFDPPYASGTFWPSIGASPSTMLPSGLVLLGDQSTPTSALYDYTTNTWTAVNSFKANGDTRSDEEDWTLLPDGSVLTVDVNSNPFPADGTNYTEKYVPSSGTWLGLPNTPKGLVDQVSVELGPGMLLYNGLTLYIGGLTHTALYNYLTNTWVSGPDQYGNNTTQTLSSEDGPGAVEINGKALICVGPVGTGGDNNYPNGLHFLEYTYSATANADGSYGSFIEVPAPTGFDTSQTGSFSTAFLQLPNGQILFAEANTTNQLYVYTPQGSPVAGAAPKITSITPNGNGSYLLRGTQFNGLTEGAYYGDDKQMSTNYPLVRFTDSAKPTAHVYYRRTYTPSTMGVATGSTPVSVNFVPPATLPSGTYSLQVVANGIASGAIKFVKP